MPGHAMPVCSYLMDRGASNEVFIEKNLVEYYLCLLHHGWLSSEGSSEAYNELHRETENVEKIQVF